HVRVRLDGRATRDLCAAPNVDRGSASLEWLAVRAADGGTTATRGVLAREDGGWRTGPRSDSRRRQLAKTRFSNESALKLQDLRLSSGHLGGDAWCRSPCAHVWSVDSDK